MSLSKKIIELRKEKELTQQQLADRLQVGQSTVSGWENELFEPNASDLRQLSLFFEVASDFLLDLEDDFGNKIKL